MKTIILFLALSSISYSRIILTEIMFNTAADENQDEFIEIYNNSDSTVDLYGWAFADNAETDLFIRYHGFTDMILKPYSYCVIMDSSYYLNSTEYEDLIPDSVLRVMINDGSMGQYGLSNSYNETIKLFDPDSVLTDSCTYDCTQEEGYTYERSSYNEAVWLKSTVLRGTPGFRNSTFMKDFDLALKSITPPDVIDPSVTNNFSLIIKNQGFVAVNNFRINAYINGVFTDGWDHDNSLLYRDTVTVEAGLTFSSAGTIEIKFEIEAEFDEDIQNNSLNLSIFVPYDQPPLVLNEFMKTPNADQCEYIEIYNISGLSVNIGDFGLSDEDKSRVVFFPDSLVPPDSYIVMAKNDFINNFNGVIPEYVFIAPGLATLNNADDSIYLLTKTGTAIDSVSYNSLDNDAGRSIEKKSPELNSSVLSNWTYCSGTGTPTIKNSVMPFDHDLCVYTGDIPIINPASYNQFLVFVKNTGLNSIDNFSLNAYIDGIYAENSIYSSPIVSGDSVSTSIELFFEHSGTVHVRFEVDTALDENLSNNSTTAQIFVPFISPPLVLNEFMKNPISGQCEYIEIYNISADSLNIGDFGLSDENKDNAVFFPDSLIPPDTFIVMAKDSLIFTFHNVLNSVVFIAPNLATLNNAYDKIFLLTQGGSAIDSIYYDNFDDDTGRSIEKINPTFRSNDLNNWVYCVNDGTPTQKNSVYQQPEDIGNSSHFKISPKTATPNGDGENDNLLISYEFDSAYIYLTMKIFNIKGQLISKPLNGDYSSSIGSIVWNCKDDNGMTVDTGAYICLLKAKDDNDKVVELKEAFYIAK
ncbi:MAG: lamin tail domain-containing protein [Candidatus Delongbacteria bacterium]|nr:lamin tail domain-containing protein [Candidatus Delongbacteria bacterium]